MRELKRERMQRERIYHSSPTYWKHVLIPCASLQGSLPCAPAHSTPLHSTPLHSTPLHSTPLHSTRFNVMFMFLSRHSAGEMLMCVCWIPFCRRDAGVCVCVCVCVSRHSAGEMLICVCVWISVDV